MFRIKKYSDEALIEEIIAGGRKEGKAIAYLIKSNREKIINLILRLKGSRMDAEDVFQEGLTAVILNIRKGTFRGESAISTYLFAVCKGIWFKRLKKNKKEQEYKSQLQVVEENVYTPEISLMNQEQKKLLMEVFERLRANCKELLYMWASAFSMKEIAEQLMYSNAQVAMNKKNKCLKQLHSMVGQDVIIQQLLKELR